MLDIVMPKAGIDMQEGRVIRWLKKEGEAVKKGEPIAEIETDKVVIEEESPIDGVMLSIIAKEGDVIPVTEVIAWVGKDGEIPQQIETSQEKPLEQECRINTENNNILNLPKVNNNANLATPYAKLLATENNISISEVCGTGENGIVKAVDVLNSCVNATPLARRASKLSEAELGSIEGSGFNGKVMKNDITVSSKKEHRVRMSGARRVIASRMAKAHLEIPPVTNTMPVDVTDLIELRRQVNQLNGVKLSINDFVLAAVADALVQCPEINVTVDGEEIIYKPNINIGVAVGTDEALLVPVIKNADKMKIFDISAKSKEYAEKTRTGKISIDDLSGGSFTVTNLGMFGITNFTPIINPPEAAILGVCAVEEKLQRIGGEIVDRKKMNICLTYDHRIIDGMVACKFLNVVRESLECPAKLLF